MIVLDQFEELFTLGERVPDLVREFRNDLGDLAENRIPADLAARIDHDEAVAARFHLRSHNYKLLISLREDFLPDLEGWRQLIPALGRSRMRLLRLRAGEALDAVHKPAAHLMTGALARRVVGIIAGEDLHRGRDTAGADVDRRRDDLGASDVEPALLSLFCRELNEERKRRGQPHFDEQLVEDAKRDILSNYYSSCVRDLPPRVADFIESELITEKGFRNSYAREDAVPSHLTDDELARLIRSRLLRLEERYGAQRIELTHDVLTGVVREHRDRRRAEEEKAALATRAERERQALEQAAAQREAKLEAEKQRQQAELRDAELRAAQDRERAAQDKQATAEAHAAALHRDSRILRAVLAGTVVIAVLALVARRRPVLRGTGADQNAGRDRAGADRPGPRHAGRDHPRRGRAGFPSDPGRPLAGQGQRYRRRPLHRGGPTGQHPENHHRPHRRGDGCGVQPRRAPAGLGQRRRHGAAVEPRHRPADRRPAHRPHRRGDRCGVQPRRAPAGLGRRRRHGAAVEPRHRPADRRPAHRPHRRGARCGVQPRRAPPRLAGADATVRLWNPDTGQPIGAPLTGHTGAVIGVAFSPDGHRLASASVDATVRLWNPDTGQPIGDPLTGHTGAVLGVAFSPDGHRLASAGADADGAAVEPRHRPADRRPLTGHTGAVTGVAFSPDGHRLASAGADATVRLWNPDTGQPIGAPLTGHTGPVWSVAFSPDGHRLATAGDDKTVRLWPALASPDMLCAKLTANMSRQQWREWISSDPSIGYDELCPGLPIPARCLKLNDPAKLKRMA